MKTTFIYLTCLIFLVNLGNRDTHCSAMELNEIKQAQGTSLNGTIQNDTLLNNIQQKIMNAFVNAKISQSDKDLLALEQALSDSDSNNKNSILIYWYSYTCYYHSILFMSVKDNKSSEKILEKGIRQLNNVSHQNSEHFALLSLMESLSIQFASGIEIPLISGRVRQNAEKALQLDSLNLRAYYVLASNDFYTPEQYGGGKMAEKYLLKAVKMKEQSISNPYLPSWGKNSAYEMLIRLYINNKQFIEAKNYYQKAVALFPYDYMINKLATELINH